MAERRMFAKTIIDSDAFLDMPSSSQALYFHLSMRADDDGFINNPKKIQRMTGSSEDDAKILLAKKFIISFESGVIVIKHWKIHNYIAKDRYKETLYKEEMDQLTLNDSNGYSMYTGCIQDDDSGKVRLGEVRLGEVNKEHGFSDWYTLYPKKVDKKDCLKIWESKKLYLIADKLIADMKTRAPIILSIARDKQFIASPAKFLRGEKWNDEIPTVSSQQKDRSAFTKTNYAEEVSANGFGENNI